MLSSSMRLCVLISGDRDLAPGKEDGVVDRGARDAPSAHAQRVGDTRHAHGLHIDHVGGSAMRRCSLLPSSRKDDRVSR